LSLRSWSSHQSCSGCPERCPERPGHRLHDPSRVWPEMEEVWLHPNNAENELKKQLENSGQIVHYDTLNDVVSAYMVSAFIRLLASRQTTTICRAFRRVEELIYTVVFSESAGTFRAARHARIARMTYTLEHCCVTLVINHR